MQPIADWLKKLGMSEYAARFAENDIDIAVLPDLTDQHLKDLGVSLGHRLKMLRAIRDLGGASAALTAPPAPMATEPARRDDAERRQLTVMFCDLVGSTALSAKLDPEDLRSVIGAYHKCVAETVARFDGFVAKYMGDGVLVYFGYPQAHEDDAERAVRAGLGLVEAVPQLATSAGSPLQVRVGIATGLVVVGDLIGSGDAQERGIVGETPNLAARLQAVAEPDTVVIAGSTRRLLGSLFELTDLGLQGLKGLAAPVQAFAVVRASSVESRFEALHAAGLTRIVGREEETDLLLRRWQSAKHDEGQVVLLCGEPGIGKSRLVTALLDRIAPEPHTRLSYFCSPHHSDSALYPVIQRMERAAGFERGDDVQARLDKLNALLEQTFTTVEDGAIFADLLSLPGGGRYPKLDLTPQERRRRTIDAMTRRLEALARRQPVLSIFEDVHWIDPTSLDVLSRMIDRIRRLRALLIVTFRPEFEPAWAGQPHVTLLTLNRLAPRECRAMLEQIIGSRQLPDDVVEEIVARTDGVPLFVEELTKAVVEAGTSEAARNQVSVTPSLALPVPATLHASLMARLDRLGPAKDVAQVGAALGREFSYELITVVAQCGDAQLADALARLTEGGLLFREGVPPHATFLFRHALIQDAAYGTLLRAKRQELHTRIANALEQHFSELCETQPEVLARHYGQAGLPQRAIGYWQRAGDRAAKRSANLEAIAHLSKALELLQALPDRSAHAEQELQVLIALGPALMTTKSSSAPEIGAVYTRARELARNAQRTADLFPTIWGAWLVAFSSANLTTAHRLVDELFGMIGGLEDPSLTLQAHHAAWPTFVATGALAVARAHIASGLALYRREEHGLHALKYGGHDPGVCGYLNEALIAATMGYLDQALRLMEQGLALARVLDHGPTLAHALWFSAELHQIRREPQQVEAFVTAVLPLLSSHGSAVGVANATMLRGWARVMHGSIEDGLSTMQEGLTMWRETGSKFQVPYRLARAADAHRAAGDIEEGLRLVGEAMHQTDDRWFAPELYRVKGELLLQAERWDEGKESLQHALSTAREQSARLLELRAATSLANFWKGRGQKDQASELLGPLCSWFTEGLETRDLQEARALLKEIDAFVG
jgi:class 3 adenylate cyclase/predicted ATPase